MNDNFNELKRIKNAIEMLSLPYEEQIKLFPSFVLTTDELALIFYDEVTKRKDYMFENRYITEETYNLINLLDTLLNKMSGKQNAHLWELKALKSTNEWFQCRQLAKEILKLL